MLLDTKAFAQVVFLGAIGLALLALLTKLPFIGPLFYLQMLLAYMGIGVAYANLAQQHGFKLDVFSTAVFGGLTAFLVNIAPSFIVGSWLLMMFGVGLIAATLGAIGGGLYAMVMGK